MKVKYILNNYQIGAKLQSAPMHKLIRKERIDRSHTEVVFDISEGQKEFCDKLFAKAGRVEG